MVQNLAMAPSPPRIARDHVVRLWFARQGLARPRGTTPLSEAALADHLGRAGALQLDSVNVVDRAHYLTLWSRYGAYDRVALDGWVYGGRVAYEYWGHETSVLPLSHLPVSRRRMRRFPGRWEEKSWWSRFSTSTASRRRVLRRLRNEGPLESVHFERRPAEDAGDSFFLPKEDKRSLKLLWHAGRVAVAGRRHFRCVYDLAERVYPEGPAASLSELEDSWLLIGLAGNGIATERHLTNYLTSPTLKAAERKRVIARNLRRKRIVEVRVDGLAGPCYALPEHLENLENLPEPQGTTLLCPFDSFLFQRRRAEDLLDFSYRIEIYVPPTKRTFGYYALPILHDGKLVGRLDPKLHRDRGVLEIKSLHLEPGFQSTKKFERALSATLADFADFLGAEDLELPRGWGARLS